MLKTNGSWIQRSLLLAPCLLILACPARAWGPDAHSAIGMVAVEQLSPATRATLETLLGGLDAQVITERCSVPLSWRASPDGGDIEALHYVNIDIDADRYDRRRDCPEDRCVTEAVIQSAARLADATIPPQQRSKAFAFLCHLTADLHQPLHVAFAEDRGGNLFHIKWGSRELNLHAFWDTALPAHYAPHWLDLAEQLRKRSNARAPHHWRPADVRLWTNETFTLTRYFAYPQGPRIDDEFARRSWDVALQQMDMAALRLTLILESALGGPSEVAGDAEADDRAAQVLAGEQPRR